MIYPSVAQLTNDNQKSRYSLVIAVSKRARDIMDEADEKQTVLNESCVKISTQQFAKGDYTFIEKG